MDERDISFAWDTLVRCRQKNGKNDPPVWIAIGMIPDGREAELVALEDAQGDWRVLHAKMPPTEEFLEALDEYALFLNR